MAELFEAVASWKSLLLLVVVFGFAPGFILRLAVKIYPPDDPRRRELIAELYKLGYVERLLFVGQQLETVLFEGLPARLRAIWSRLRRSAASQAATSEMQPEDGVYSAGDSGVELEIESIETETRVLLVFLYALQGGWPGSQVKVINFAFSRLLPVVGRLVKSGS